MYISLVAFLTKHGYFMNASIREEFKKGLHALKIEILDIVNIRTV